MMITFGKLRILDMGDLTWAKERPLMCPVNKLGKVDVYVVSHHGFDRSSSPALLDAIGARVAIMDNGAVKGDEPAAWDIIDHAPGLKDLWQLHSAITTTPRTIPATPGSPTFPARMPVITLSLRGTITRASP